MQIETWLPVGISKSEIPCDPYATGISTCCNWDGRGIHGPPRSSWSARRRAWANSLLPETVRHYRPEDQGSRQPGIVGIAKEYGRKVVKVVAQNDVLTFGKNRLQLKAWIEARTRSPIRQRRQICVCISTRCNLDRRSCVQPQAECARCGSNTPTSRVG